MTADTQFFDMFRKTEREVFGPIANDGLKTNLERVALIIEKRCESAFRVSILLASADGTKLHHGAAPSLSDVYNEQIDGLLIGPNSGVCGSAAHFGHPIFVHDVTRDERCEAFRDLAVSHTLLACWSVPIIDSNQKLLGTFALYWNEPQVPSTRDRALIAAGAQYTVEVLEHHSVVV